MGLVLSITLNAQTVNLAEWTAIPDINFEKGLIEHGIDDVLDGKVLTSNVIGVKKIQIEHAHIKDMTGLSSFISLEWMSLWDNDITTIDVSNNTKLKLLGLSQCPIEKVDLSKNTELVEIDFQNSEGYEFGMKELDLTYNTKLERIYIWDSRITTLDVSMCPNLIDLWCSNHHIKKLDLSNNHMLNVLVADNGELEYLNIKGTYNNGLPRTCKTDNNPNLKEILVTNVESINTWRNTYINNGANLVSEAWWAKDEHTKYIETGNLGFNLINYNNTLTIYPNPAKDHITIDLGNISDFGRLYLEITNSLGQVVFNQPLNTHLFNIALNTWSVRGMYFVNVYDATNKVLSSRKIIIE